MVSRLKYLIKPDIKTNIFALFIFACIILFYNIVIGIAALGIVLYLYYYNKKVENGKKQMLKEYIENITEEVDETIRYSVIDHPLPICMVDRDGIIFWVNKRFIHNLDRIDILHTRITDLVGIKMSDLLSEEKEKQLLATYNNKTYRLATS